MRAALDAFIRIAGLEKQRRLHWRKRKKKRDVKCVSHGSGPSELYISVANSAAVVKKERQDKFHKPPGQLENKGAGRAIQK